MKNSENKKKVRKKHNEQKAEDWKKLFKMVIGKNFDHT